MKRGYKKHAGVAMALTLIVLTIMVVIGFALGAIGTRNLTINLEKKQELAAAYAAEMGIARALHILGQNPSYPTQPPPTPTFTGGGISTNTSFSVQIRNNLSGATAVPGIVLASVPPGHAEFVSTGTAGSFSKRIVVLATSSGFTPFTFAAFGDVGVALDSGSGSGSCDSTLGNCNPSCPGPNGDIGSNANITLDSGATVDGSLKAGGTVTPFPIRPPTRVTGTVTQSAPRVTLPAINTAYQLPNNNGSIGGSGWYWSPPGSRNLHITNSGIAILPAGTYYFDSIHIDSGGQLQVPASLGPTDKVVVNLTGYFYADSGSRVNNLTQVPGKLQILSSATNTPSPTGYAVKFDSGTGFYGTVYAPNGTIRLDAGSRVYGSIVGKALSWDSGSRFCYDTQLGSVRVGSGGTGMLKKAWFAP